MKFFSINKVESFWENQIKTSSSLMLDKQTNHEQAKQKLLIALHVNNMTWTFIPLLLTKDKTENANKMVDSDKMQSLSYLFCFMSS